MKHMRLSVHSIIKGFYTFLLMILFATLIVLLGLWMSAFNDKVIVQKVNESNYYNEVHDELNKRAEEIVTQAGLPVSVLDNVITLERVYVNGKNYIEATLAGKDFTIQTAEMKEKLSANINQYLIASNIEITDELKSGVEAVITDTEKLYEKAVEIKLMSYLYDYKSSFLRIIWAVLPIVIFLIGVLCYFLIRMSRYKHRGIRQLSYAALASSSMVIISSLYVFIAKPYQKLTIAPDYYRDFLMVYFNWDLKVLLYMGFLGIIVSVVLITFVGYLKNRLSSD